MKVPTCDDHALLRFGPYELDDSCMELRRDGEKIRIQGKPFTLLLYLVKHAGRVVSHAEMNSGS